MGCIVFFTTKVSVVRAGLRAYAVLFSIITVLNELEWTSVVRSSIYSYSWIARGLFYFFIGLLVLDHTLVTLRKVVCSVYVATFLDTAWPFLVLLLYNGLIMYKESQEMKGTSASVFVNVDMHLHNFLSHSLFCYLQNGSICTSFDIFGSTRHNSEWRNRKLC